MIFIFDVEPIGKPRMTQRDKWAKRKCVVEYYMFKDLLNIQARHQKYFLGETLDIEFIIPFPKSYSKKKCFELDKTPHREKPDIDNMLKAFMDALSDDDKKVHTIKAKKTWGEKGRILVNDANVYTEKKIEYVRDKVLPIQILWTSFGGDFDEETSGY